MSLNASKITNNKLTVLDLKPITPATTPFRRVPQTESLHRHSLLESPSSRDETIKASGSKKLPPVGSCQELFSPPKSRPGGLPSPPITTAMSFPATHDTAPMPNPSDFMMDLSMNFNFPANEQEYDSSSYSPLSTALSPSQSSLLSSPEMEQLALFGNPLETAPRLEVPGENMTSPSSKIAAGLCDGSSPTNGALSPGAMSIADLSIDATVEDTGITIDDIASFIEGPEPSDGKWVCSFPECNKRFGRKENIKSHVQTHLGDRQFRCNHCHKCFVRQHDLKRHSKIHSGVKPYPCLCGNSFARHDALTRHRQRGMCIGAFEGAVKKVAKRGRPRKQRPEAEARREKASKTRKRAIAMSTTSSSSGNSNQSSQHSPALTYESFSSRETSPLDVLTHGLESDVTPMPRYTFNYTPPTSPDHGLGTYVSPQHIQKMHSPVSSFGESPKRNSVVSNFEGSVALPSNPTSPSKRCSSHDNTPPELCLASSSPPPMNFFDLDKASAQLGGNADMGRKANGGEDELVDYRIPGIDDPEPDMFLSFDNTEDDLASLEKEFGLLKDFDNGMSNDDLFQDPGCGTDMFF
ncbi:MAG: Metallothionein expression activator [Sclerophora amabilis]|nr:MAG: Metallothionein expression activator [Sclerophora amabilis]